MVRIFHALCHARNTTAPVHRILLSGPLAFLHLFMRARRYWWNQKFVLRLRDMAWAAHTDQRASARKRLCMRLLMPSSITFKIFVFFPFAASLRHRHSFSKMALKHGVFACCLLWDCRKRKKKKVRHCTLAENHLFFFCLAWPEPAYWWQIMSVQ